MGREPLIRYLHHWTGQTGVRSTLLAHNFYALLANRQGVAYGRVRLFGADGRLRDDQRLAVEWHLALPMPTEGEGAVELALSIPAWFPKEPDRAAARFSMLYESPDGMCSTVHCIEEAPVRTLGGWLRWRRGGAWQSKRTIPGRGLQRIRVVGLNHAPCSTTLHWGVRGVRSGRVWEVEARRPSRALLALEVIPPQEDDWVVWSRALATPNGKPYVWTWYGEAPPAVHHG